MQQHQQLRNNAVVSLQRAPQLSAGFLCSNLFKNVTSAGGTTQAITTTFALKVGEMSDIMETDSGVHTS
ncbi:hypothetical protein GIB67_002910 [Kingdonia uniflora]|uniref:Uncharacterized protein n=1 Tax=Kingdonia uniflora TaxID=39325 RepID=A0A7J7M571_9MAGN|nr:hypothetical protein GIB67_002910 [Kingdonia uniflora]